MSYNVKLEGFEGPFDLLFHLIEKAKVDIYNIPIAQITEQYIQYIEEMNKFDLEIASEFLVMVATLIEIKSKMLLPRRQEEQLAMELEAEDPRQDLVKKLIEYKKYKNAAIELKKREEIYKKVFYKQQEQLDQFIKYEVQEVDNIDIKDLLDAFHNLLNKKMKKTQQSTVINQIKRDEITLEDRIDEIKVRLINCLSIKFEELFLNPINKSEVVVTFLALLELIKLKFLVVQQNEIFGEIIVKKITVSNEVL